MSASAPQIPADANPHRYVSADDKIQIDERVWAGSNLSAASGTFPIFGYRVSGSMQGMWPVRCYAMLLASAGGELLRDFIPVRVGYGSSAVGYLYDRANPTGGPLGNGLYPNAGTGAFVIGPDK